MSKEVYSPEIMAAIADRLRPLDRQKKLHTNAAQLLSPDFRKSFGRFSFAGIEQVFRASNFNAHCLAVPEEAINKKMNRIITVALDDFDLIHGAGRVDASLLARVTRVPFAGYIYRDASALRLAVQDWGIQFDPILNSANLHEAGIMVPVPGSPIARQATGFRNLN